MSAKRGRRPNPEQAQRNADFVYLRVGAKIDLDMQHGRMRKGQLCFSAVFTKQELPVAADLLKVMPRTLERHYYDHRQESKNRIVQELVTRLNDRDRANQLKRFMDNRQRQNKVLSEATNKSKKNKK